MMITVRWEYFITSETSHLGNPCRFCGQDHDAVGIGGCPGRPSPAMLSDAIDALLACSQGRAFTLERLEAQAILDVLETMNPYGTFEEE